ncbi:MAG: DNA repair protein RadA [Paludibacteraceae bacterium]|nr:DNA repair protein RadA [Paludibacteraceae bacterium]
MAKTKSIYVCQSCGLESPNWAGQCSDCGAWNSFVETVKASVAKSGLGAGRTSSGSVVGTVNLAKVKQSDTQRISSKIKEFDRVIGGGFVPGQVILIAGTPGIGKSTLLTQISKELDDKNVLYVCGEESVNQVKIRANRMDYPANNLYLLQETNVESVVASIEHENAQLPLSLIIVDSIQSLYSEDLSGMAGSVGQVRGSTAKLVGLAKTLGIPMLLVGHVTKEGTVAGPKVLEHMVDTVLYLEGDSNHLFRILKTTKNRFGPVSEVGIFEMVETGMIEVANPSELFLGDSQNASGSCVTVVMEGYRPLLFEIQALTVKTSFGYPKRTASGYSVNRLHVLLATLEKRCGLKVSDYDVYLSVSGGYKVSEYSCDLAVCLAIASSIKEKALKAKTVAFGECDLSGGVRQVPYQHMRINEAKKLGYKNLVTPESVKTIVGALKLAID